MSRSRRAQPLWSVLAIVACLLGQLAGSVHSATVQHVACAEHGGVVELHGDRAPARQPAHTTIGASLEEGHHGHCERCATPAARFDGSAPIAHRPIAAATAAPSPPTPPRADAIARFRLAPKGSPPRSV